MRSIGGRDGMPDRDKNQIRERIWRLLVENQVTAPDVFGYIPDFVGSDEAAALLGTTSPWRSAKIVKANPDQAQLPVRARALAEGKILYMAVPKIASLDPFYFIDPRSSSIPPAQAASSEVASELSPKVAIEQMRSIDLVVCGSVAVNRQGARLGKGAGYSDIEVALLIEAGLVTDDTTIVTTVHSLQVIDDALPESSHDFRVDYIATEREIIPCGRSQRPSGLVWPSLPADKIAAIPILAARARGGLN
jgi:5-formyltetrahydrofolate cyclo-ligase